MKGVAAYSLLPLALEGVAALRPGEEGREAAKAFRNDVVEAVSGFLPIAGEYFDARSAALGRDLNGRELSTNQRIVAGTMGALGTASLVLAPFTGGLSVVGMRGLRGIMAARRAKKIVTAAKKGVNVIGGTGDAIKTIARAEKSAEKLESMLKLTETQRKIRRVRNFVQNSQRSMQIVTYGHLGIQIASGIAGIYGNFEGFIGNVQDKTIEVVDKAEEFIFH